MIAGERQRTGEFHIRVEIPNEYIKHEGFLEHVHTEMMMKAAVHIMSCIDDGRKYTVQIKEMEDISPIIRPYGETDKLGVDGYVGLDDITDAISGEYYWKKFDQDCIATELVLKEL